MMIVATPAQQITDTFQPQAEELTAEQRAKRDWLRQRFAKRPAKGEGIVITREAFREKFEQLKAKIIASRK